MEAQANTLYPKRNIYSRPRRPAIKQVGSRPVGILDSQSQPGRRGRPFHFGEPNGVHDLEESDSVRRWSVQTAGKSYSIVSIGQSSSGVSVSRSRRPTRMINWLGLLGALTRPSNCDVTA